jgi:hypothetical protein
VRHPDVNDVFEFDGTSYRLRGTQLN